MKKGVKFNMDMEEPLAASERELDAALQVLGNAKMACYAYLKRQFSARAARAVIDKCTYPEIGTSFRDKSGKKLKMTPTNGEDKHAYLQALVLQMMKADARREHSVVVEPTLSGLVRLNPIIDCASTDPVSIRAKAIQDHAVGLKAMQSDDPWLVELDREYVGKLCFLHDISLRHKLYRICRVAYWPSTKTRYASWEGTMEPVHVDQADGSLYQLDEDVVQVSDAKRITKANKLVGYILAEYIDGDDAEPTRSDCVDRYAFQALEKHNTFTLKCATLKEATPTPKSAPHVPPRPPSKTLSKLH
jgi:hypothetical protein